MKCNESSKRVKIVAFTFLSYILISGALGCTKVSEGYISPTMQYSTKLFVAPQGQIAQSNSLVADGSNLPLHIEWTHIYDSTGKVVDDIFQKKYPVGVWTKAYDPKTDTSYATIMAKRTTEELTPFTVNSTSGVITTNAATLFVPTGIYSIDMKVSNVVGTREIKNAISLQIQEAEPVQTADEGGVGSFSLSRLKANTSGGAETNGGVSPVMFNGNNNPFVVYSVTRVSDTPNVLSVEVFDKNGAVFNPKAGEIKKRPNAGLNPIPPFLQNLQDYAPDTFNESDTAMSLKYPLTPFPISSLGNGYNMYYILPAKYIQIDSTSNWTTNVPGVFYKGTSDPHYLGTFENDLYDYSFRIPLRIQVPGNYLFKIQFLNVTRR